MDFQQSRTYRNLITAYDNELMFSTRFEIYADIARNEGYIEIGNIFDITAGNDKQHARTWLRTMNQGILPTTIEALQSSFETENEMAGVLYQEFARTAREEGYYDIAALFSGVANIDFNHSFQFQNQYQNILNNEVFCKSEQTLWICMQCGNILSGECAPLICPVCGFPQGYYRVFSC